jgi:Flp pilus assembly protein TadG
MQLARLRRFARDRKGLAAVEFALIAPMMVLLLLGSVEIVNILQTNRRAENTAASLADVVSRDTEVSDQEVAGLWAATTPLMFPDTPVGLDIRITSIRFDSTRQGRVVWSERCALMNGGGCGASGYSQLMANAIVANSEMPSEMRVPETSVVRVETTYRYRPALGFFFMESTGALRRDGLERTLRHVAYRRSRLVDPIPRVS